MTDEQYQATLYALATSNLRRAIGTLDTLRELLGDHPPDDIDRNTLPEVGSCAAGAQAYLVAAVEAIEATRLDPGDSGAPAAGATP